MLSDSQSHHMGLRIAVAAEHSVITCGAGFAYSIVARGKAGGLPADNQSLVNKQRKIADLLGTAVIVINNLNHGNAGSVVVVGNITNIVLACHNIADNA